MTSNGFSADHGASPYRERPARAFWKSGVAAQNLPDIVDLYRKKFDIAPTDQIVTAGSCFAQHIGRGLRKRGFNLLDVEPAPLGLDGEQAQKFGYGLYSARYGNIYTAGQLLQLGREAFSEVDPANPVWEKDGRFFDAMRPAVEPDGFAKSEHVKRHRRHHLARVREAFSAADLFIFTFGLTEAWVDQATGTVYPTAPGTIAGHYDPEIYAFRNFHFAETYRSFCAFRDLLRRHNPAIRFILTVSPVPLTATATDDHVLVATTYSKSVLRAVGGQLCQEYDDVDYFPSYELIAAPASRGVFYDANLRSVTAAGVDAAMRLFFEAHGTGAIVAPAASDDADTPESPNETACEDLLLEAFAR